MNQVAPTLIAAGLLFLITMLPLIPAVIIYKLFPNTVVKTTGPLAGLTLNTSGAFGIYIIVFVVLTPFAYRTYNLVAALSSPSWTITGEIQVVNEAGEKIPFYKIKKGDIVVSFQPKLSRVDKDHFRIKVPEIDNSLPTLNFSYGNAGSEVINLDDPGKYSIDRNEGSKTITFEGPIVIRAISAPGDYNPKGHWMNGDNNQPTNQD